MNRYWILFYALILSFFLVSSASGQFRQVHLETDENHAVKLSFYTSNEGYVAFNRFIGFTTDSGRTFIQKPITSTNVNFNGYNANLTFGFSIYGLKALDRRKIIVYGNYGLVPAILYSNDQGNTFTLVYHSQLNNVPNSSIQNVAFTSNGLTGFAVDADRILKTTDGGLSWQPVKTIQGALFTNINYINNTLIFVYGLNGKCYKTTDAGTNWSEVNLPGSTFKSLYFFNETKGWLNDNEGSVFMTINGGSTWVRQNVAPLPSLQTNKMTFFNDSTGFAISENDNFEVYKTSNFGKIWERLPRDNKYKYLNYTLNDLQIINNQIWVAGAHGLIELSTNSGGLPIPKSIFKTDTSGLSVTNNVKLNNYSKPGYKYQWLLNHTLISTDYNSSYLHDIYRLNDTIQLVAANGPYADTVTQYLKFNPPVIINSFTPVTGAQGTTVTITGINFLNAKSVSFGGIIANSFKVISSTTITAVVGTGASGKVGISTPLGGGVRDGFTFIPPPVISSFFPTAAKAGTSITITGNNFTAVSAVRFGVTPAASFVVESPTKIVAVVGPGNSGSITVTASGGTISSPGFAMIPIIDSFTPTSGTFGTVLSITGTGLDRISEVLVGTVPVRSFVINSATNITAVIDATSTGMVQVNAPAGSSSKPGFVYYKPPHISSFAPAFGPAGTTVTLNGTNFSNIINENVVWCGTVKAEILNATSNALIVKISAGITNGYISVQTHHLTDYTSTPFTVTLSNNNSIAPKSFTTNTDSLTASVDLPVIGDLDGDGKADIVTFSRDDVMQNQIHIYTNTSLNGKVSFNHKALKLEYAYLSNMQLTDIDGDGLLELIGISLGKINIYRNISTPGNIEFDAPLAIGLDNSAFYENLLIKDIDGDGRADMLVRSSGTLIFWNKSEPGKIDFYKGESTPIESLFNAQVHDFNNDGKIDFLLSDIAVSINASLPGKFILGSKVQVNNADWPYMNVGAADIDGDGKLDAIALKVAGKMSIYRNTGSQENVSFGAETSYQTADVPKQCVFSDFDGDGKIDIAVLNTRSNTVQLFKNLSNPGTVKLAAPISYSINKKINDLQTWDVNGDGRMDLVLNSDKIIYYLLNVVQPAPLITSFTPTTGVSGTSIEITGSNFTNVSAVTFGGMPAASFKINSPESITAILGNGMSGSVSVVNPSDTCTLPGFAYGAPPVITSFTPSSGSVGTTVTINGKNFDPVAGNNIVYFGKIKATIKSASANMLTVIVPPAASEQLLTVTVNKNTAYSQKPFMLTFNSDVDLFTAKSFAKPHTIKTGRTASGDFDNDGKLDWAACSNDGLVVARNIGSADIIGFTSPVSISKSSNILQILVTDLDGDGKMDLLTLNNSSFSSSPSGPPAIKFFRNTSTTGNISFAAELLLISFQSSGNTSVINIAVNDLDGDGKTDIAAADYDLKTITVFRNLSVGDNLIFEKPFNYLVGDYAGAVSLTDMDDDHKPDIVAIANGQLSVFKNTSLPGGISFDGRKDFRTDTWLLNLSLGDIDNDGKTDAVVTDVATDAAGVADNVIVFHNTTSNGIISFNKTNFLTKTQPAAIKLADLNGDGKPELILDDQYNSSFDPTKRILKIFKNISTANNIVFDKELAIKSTYGFELDVADMDQNGKPDIILSDYPATILRNNSQQDVLLYQEILMGANYLVTYGISDFIPQYSSNNTAIPVVISSGDTTIATVKNNLVHVLHAGTVTLTANQAGDSTHYQANPVNQILKISPANLVITANDASKGFGEDNPAFTVKYRGFAYSDNNTKLSSLPVPVTTATKASQPGTYPITVNGAISPDYDISYLPGTLTIYPNPVVSSMSPQTGRTGTSITITGSNFNRVTSVSFGGVEAAFYTINSPTSITAVIGSGKSGDVMVTTAGGKATLNGFTYDPSPLVTSFSPAITGPQTQVIIDGNNFQGATAVNFGGVPAASFLVINPSRILAIVGAGASGDISVITPYGTSRIAGYTFVEKPVITTNSTIIFPGVNVVLAVNPAAGLAYQWFKDGVAIAGAVSANYTAVKSGSYTVKITISGYSVTSSAVAISDNYTLPATNFKISLTSVSCKGLSNGVITIVAEKSLNYTATLTGKSSSINSFNSSSSFTGLPAGNYKVCMSIYDQPGYQQCFDVVITEPKDLTVYAITDKDKGTVSLNMSGSANYQVLLNGRTYQTSNSTLTLPLVPGSNNLTVTTDKPCQGSFEKIINISGNTLPFPNPFQDVLYINLGEEIVAKAEVRIYTVSNGALKHTEQFANQSGVIKLGVAGLNTGIYSLHLNMNGKTIVYKIFKQ